MKNKAVFIDRDGTINVDVHYLNDPDKFEMYRGVGEGVEKLKENGFKIIVITNQSGIARGYFSEKQLSDIHERMKKEFREFNVELDGIYYCPHHPDDNCDCRKPNTGLFEKAIKKHDIDTKNSCMIGDKILDIEAGKKIGSKTILIPEPHLRDELLSRKKEWEYDPDHIAHDFRDAVDWILDNEKKDIASDIPLVSIITPVLNGVKYLETCIQSVLTQSYPHIEHIFVDGGSKDGTVEMLTGYQSMYPDRIRLFTELKKGPGPALNKGLRLAKGEIFGLLCSDDFYEPDAIMAVVDFFRENPGAYFVFGECNYIDNKGAVIKKIPSKDFDLKEIINEGCFVPTPSSFYRREVYEKVGNYIDFIGDDLDYLIRIADAFQIHRINKVLSNFRVHEGSQTTGSNKNVQIMTLRRGCIVSRRYGGRYFSGYRKRYYMVIIIESLRPIMGFSYPYLLRIIRHLRHKKV